MGNKDGEGREGNEGYCRGEEVREMEDRREGEGEGKEVKGMIAGRGEKVGIEGRREGRREG